MMKNGFPMSLDRKNRLKSIFLLGKINDWFPLYFMLQFLQSIMNDSYYILVSFEAFHALHLILLIKDFRLQTSHFLFDLFRNSLIFSIMLTNQGPE